MSDERISYKKLFKILKIISQTMGTWATCKIKIKMQTCSCWQFLWNHKCWEARMTDCRSSKHDKISCYIWLSPTQHDDYDVDYHGYIIDDDNFMFLLFDDEAVITGFHFVSRGKFQLFVAPGSCFNWKSSSHFFKVHRTTVCLVVVEAHIE